MTLNAFASLEVISMKIPRLHYLGYTAGELVDDDERVHVSDPEEANSTHSKTDWLGFVMWFCYVECLTKRAMFMTTPAIASLLTGMPDPHWWLEPLASEWVTSKRSLNSSRNISSIFRCVCSASEVEAGKGPVKTDKLWTTVKPRLCIVQMS